MKKKHQSIRLFENPVLEKLTYVHPVIPIAFWAPVIAFLFWRGYVVHELSVAELALTLVAGVFFWTFAEYILHRFAFHFEGSSKLSQRVHFLIHGNHHEDPNDPLRLLMPPIAGVVIAAPFYLFFNLVLGPSLADPFMAAFLIGYLIYDYSHFANHHWIPRNAYMRALKQRHMIHHFVDSQACWGVSSPLWDWVFGSMERRRQSRQIEVG